MREDQYFRFSTNVSVESYKSKEEACKCLDRKGAKEIGRETMAFREQTITVSDFLSLAISGHTFCALFDYDPQKKIEKVSPQGHPYKTYPVFKGKKINAGAMKPGVKADEFFKGSQVIFVDVDYTRFQNVPDYLYTLTFPPTCVYMSYSDKKDKGGVISRRFRLVYVFDQLLNRDDFSRVSNAITRQIEQDTQEPMEDDCGTRPSQYMNGVYGNPETYQRNMIYSIYDFPPPPPQPVLIQPTIQTITTSSQITFDEKMVNEMKTLPYDAFMHRNSWRGYVYRTESPVWLSGGYQMTDEDYLQIWYCKEKVKDGNHRRRKLLKNACLRRLIAPNMDPDTALFNLYVDFVRFFDNSDWVITPDTLMNRVKKAFELSFDDLREICQEDIMYWQENRPDFILKNIGIDNRGAIKEIQKIINYAKLDSVYDPNLSVKENYEIGLGVSLQTLYRYAHDRWISPNPHKQITERERRAEKEAKKEANVEKFKQLYNPNLSCRDNQENMKKEGLDVSYETIRKWAKLYISREEANECSFGDPTSPIFFKGVPVPNVDWFHFGSGSSEG